MAVREDLKNKTQILDDLEDDNQEILWVKIALTQKDNIFIGIYYGKQETAPIDDIEKYYSQLKSQKNKLKLQGK